MVRPAGWSGCGSSPTVLPSRKGGSLLGGKRGTLLKVNDQFFKSWAFAIFPLQSLPDLSTIIPEIWNIPTIQKLSESKLTLRPFGAGTRRKIDLT